MHTVLQVFAFSVALLIVLLIRRLTAKSSLDNIPGPPAESFRHGNLRQILSRDGWGFYAHIASAYGGVVKLHGLFGDKQLYVFDTGALHHIAVKNHYIYDQTEVFLTTWREMFGTSITSTKGAHHHKQRKMLNPVFSTVHMRHMLPTFYTIAGRLRDAIALQVQNDTAEINMSRWCSRTALEMIGQCGLGCSYDPLTEDSANPYTDAIKNLSSTMHGITAIRQVFPFIVEHTSAKFRKFVMNILPWKTLHDLRDVSNILHEMAKEVLESRRSALAKGDEAVAEQVGEGKDLMSILLRANMKASTEDALSEEELLGLVSAFIFAAMDTSSTAVSIILHTLAEHPKEQEMLRKEIITARQGGIDQSYDDLVSLPYLDAICRETLRLHAIIPTVVRTTRQEMVLPLSKPIRGLDGKEIKEIVVPNDTDLILGLMAVNRNPEIWGEDVMEWKPERWLSPLPDSVMEAHIPGVYNNSMTFFGGGRSCIGFKFAQMEIKVLVSLLLESFRFSPGKEVTWNMATKIWPSVNNSNTPQMPLRVSKV